MPDRYESIYDENNEVYAIRCTWCGRCAVLGVPINHDNCPPAMKISVVALTSMIYDTLMRNVGMSESHISFPIDEVVSSETSANTITIVFASGDKFRVRIDNG